MCFQTFQYFCDDTLLEILIFIDNVGLNFSTCDVAEKKQIIFLIWKLKGMLEVHFASLVSSYGLDNPTDMSNPWLL